MPECMDFNKPSRQWGFFVQQTYVLILDKKGTLINFLLFISYNYKLELMTW